MRTITHTSPGPVDFSLDVDVADVVVHVGEYEVAVVVLEPVDPADEDTARLIEQTTHTSNGRVFTVRVPRPAGGHGGTTVVQRGPGHVSVVGQVVTGSVVGLVLGGDAHGSTIVNGQVISGSGTTFVGSRGMRITVHLPVGSSLSLAGQSPDLTTYGPLRRVDAKTVSGRLDVAEAAIAQLASMSGGVRVRACPDVHAETMSGSVVVQELAGRAIVSTMSGDVRIHAVADSTVSARTMSGDIDLTAPAGVEIGTETRTMSGRVRNRRR